MADGGGRSIFSHIHVLPRESEQASDEPDTHNDEYCSREGWQVRSILFYFFFIVFISRNQQQRQTDDTEHDGQRVGTHQFQTVLRPDTQRDDLEFLLMSEPEDECEPRNLEKAPVSCIIEVVA